MGVEKVNVPGNPFLAQDDKALSEKRVLGLLGLVWCWLFQGIKGFCWG